MTAAVKTVAANKDAKVTTKTTDMTLDEKIELMRKLETEIKEESVKDFEKDVNYVVARAKSKRLPLLDYITALVALLTEEERKSFQGRFYQAPVAAPKAVRAVRAAGSKPAKETADKDATGARPNPGTTYIINGLEWTKSVTGKGRAKSDFLDAIKGGAKWEEMVKK